MFWLSRSKHDNYSPPPGARRISRSTSTRPCANFPSITGTGETVAIIDEGTDYNNPDLGGGYGKVVIDSYDFDDNSWDVMPYDNNAHGTGTSGQIAGQPHVYNGQLYEGVAPGVKIIALHHERYYRDERSPRLHRSQSHQIQHRRRQLSRLHGQRERNADPS